MKIQELENLNNGERVEFNALISDKKTGWKKDGSPYLMLVMQDNTGTIAFPVWDNYENLNSHININLVIHNKGIVTRFNETYNKESIINIVNEEIDYGLYTRI